MVDARQGRRQGRRPSWLAAARGLAVHCARLRRHCDVHLKGTGGFSRRHADDGGHRVVVRHVLLHAVFRHPVSHHRGRGDAADALFGRAQHRKNQQDHDAAVFHHLPDPRGARGDAAGRKRGLPLHVHSALGGAQGPDDLDLGDGTGVLLPLRHGQRHDRVRRVPLEGRGRRRRRAAHGAV